MYYYYLLLARGRGLGGWVGVSRTYTLQLRLARSRGVVHTARRDTFVPFGVLNDDWESQPGPWSVQPHGVQLRVVVYSEKYQFKFN